jgi:predicted helicase
MTERLGIVYTPVEAVDFIIHSVNEVLQTEFNQTLGSENVHIIDPFTGTGTFITRLLQSGLIPPEKLTYKYKNEIHANEIILLAYYIAAINIESVYHDLVGGDYEPFNGICLTDTFQLHEKDDLVSELLVDNSARRNKQKALDIRVIIGNPPYSAGQASANDNNANIPYPNLDKRIGDTYAKNSNATSKKNLMDSYIRAIRWASDRVKNAGVIGFITNAGFIEANTGDGLRKCLAEEFSNIYVFHLRGNARTSGELRRKEKDNVFGQGTRTPIAISILVKNPNAKEQGKIYFHDIGDYLDREQKLQKISEFFSIKGMTERSAWSVITPDKHNDWLNQRDDSFSEHISLGDKKDKNVEKLFDNFSLGLASGRDAWVYNFSRGKLLSQIEQMINFYNNDVKRFLGLNLTVKNEDEVDSFITVDTTKISWNRNLKSDFIKKKYHSFNKNALTVALYRPFTKSHLYFDKAFNAMQYQNKKIFPEIDSKNLVIILNGVGAKNGLSVLISNKIVDLNFVEAGSQCFPLFLYETYDQELSSSLFDTPTSVIDMKRREGITDNGLAHFNRAYPNEKITKEDIFYYVYGLLQSEDYKTRYADNLSKEIPRIPCVKKAKDFWTFSKAGRALADLHINYETIKPYPVEYEQGSLAIQMLNDEDYRVKEMKFAKGKDSEKYDKTKVIYNSKITMTGIPLQAYEYVVNGKPALEWVMERQAVTTHKDSGIVNDANDWAIETMGNPKYPLELFQRVITVSLETMKIVKNLPMLDI